MRLIDADPLLKAVKENKELYERERLYLEGLLLNAPTVEPFERIGAICNENCGFYRPQGEWIKQYNKSYELKTNEGILVGEFTKCPKCQYDKARGSNFCPNCGADMRGKEE
ncbi:hypothetical protein IKP13_04880 [bacterium]|nr:hypothetical protein [bacterium]